MCGAFRPFQATYLILNSHAILFLESLTRILVVGAEARSYGSMLGSLHTVGLAHSFFVTFVSGCLLFLFLFRDKDRIVGQQVIFDPIERLQTALSNSTDWIAIVKVKQSNAESSADILKHLDCVARCDVFANLTLLSDAFNVVLRVHIRDRGLALDLACLFVKFWCKVVDTTATGIIALQCVAIRQPG